MPQPPTHNPHHDQSLQPALAPLHSEEGGPSDAASDVVPQLTNSELVQLQIRVIALENLMIALLADASDEQLARVRDIAASISPRPGVDHKLTVHAAAQMAHLSQRATRL